MRCDSIVLIGDTLTVAGTDFEVISAGPLDEKRMTYSFIVKVNVSKELVDELIKNKLKEQQ